MTISVGQRIPQAWLAEINDSKIVEVATETLFAGRRAVMIGVPGAFTPICTEKHLPDFVAGAEKLKVAGYDTIICLAANDPWTVKSWADTVDPLRKIRFLSDGNLDFSRKLGLTEVRRDLYLGERTSRFLMILENAVIQRLTVEPFIEHLTRTRCDDIFL